MSDDLHKRVDALIVAERNKGRSFGECMRIANETFGHLGIALSRSATGARYNRAVGKPNAHKSEGKRIAVKDKLPHPRMFSNKPASYDARKSVDPKHYAMALAKVEDVKTVIKSELFLLKPGMRFATLTELRTTTCRWPLEAADGRTFYCGRNSDGTLPYCSEHMHVARRGL